MLVAPLPNWLLVLGYVSGGVMRGLLVGLVVTGVTLFFTRIPVEHPLLVLASVLLTAIVFSLGGLFNAIFAKSFDQISWFPTFVLTPLTYLGGVFYSISLLPEWAQSLSHANPVLYMVSAFRHGFLGNSDVNIGLAFAIMTVSAIVMFAVVVMLMNRGTGIRE
jgi:ABC-2 type transport system permease protein